MSLLSSPGPHPTEVSQELLAWRLVRVFEGLTCWGHRGLADREAFLDDVQWNLIEPLLPPQRSGVGRPMRGHGQVAGGVIYRSGSLYEVLTGWSGTLGPADGHGRHPTRWGSVGRGVVTGGGGRSLRRK